MAFVNITIGSMEDVHTYDDVSITEAIKTTAPISAGTPVTNDHVIRLQDVGATVGNIIGPATSTDNAITRFNGATGEVVQNSTLILDNSGNLSKTGDLDITCGTEKTLELQTGVWEDLRVSVNSVKRLGFSDPGWLKFKANGAGSTGTYTLAFSPTIDEEVYFTVQLPHSFKQGTTVRPHVHWAPPDANTGGITWGLEYTWVNINGTFGNTTITTANDSTDGVAFKHHLAPFTPLSGVGKNISSMLVCRLFRDVSDVNDTYASDIYLLEFDIHFQINTMGSRQETVK